LDDTLNYSDLDKYFLEDDVESLLDSTLENEIEDLYEFNDSAPPLHSEDGKVKLSVSADEMSVRASFYPPKGDGTPITALNVYEKLESIGVVEPAILKDTVEDYIKRLSTRRQVYNDIEIASGQSSSAHIPSYILLARSLKNKLLDQKDELPKEDNKSRIDYKNVSSITIVRKGTVLAKSIDAVEGVSGKTVKGKDLPFSEAKVQTVKLGKNVEISGNNKIVSSVDGEVVFNKNELSVSNVFRLNTGVNYKTGHIKFPGTVMIKGEVEDGFNIIAESNIYVSNTLAVTNVYCGGDLLIEGGGIIGRKKNKVLVKGSVRTSYIENVHLEAFEDIFVERSTLNSNISSNGTISFGENGRIVGGTIHARNEIAVKTIGNNSGAETNVFCGTDFSSINKLMIIRKHRIKLVSDKEKILAMTREANTDEVDSEILKCDLGSQQILQKMVYNEEAKIHVWGTVFPGTVIDICLIKHTVKSPKINGFFSLYKKDGTVRFQPY